MIITADHLADDEFNSIRASVSGGFTYTPDVATPPDIAKMTLTIVDPDSQATTVLTRGTAATWAMACPIRPTRAFMATPGPHWVDANGNHYDAHSYLKLVPNEKDDDSTWHRYDALSLFGNKGRFFLRPGSKTKQYMKLYSPLAPALPTYAAGAPPPCCKYPEFINFDEYSTAESLKLDYDSTPDLIRLLNAHSYRLPLRKPPTVQLGKVRIFTKNTDDYTEEDFQKTLETFFKSARIRDNSTKIDKFRESLGQEQRKQLDTEKDIFIQTNGRDPSYDELMNRWKDMQKDGQRVRRKKESWHSIVMSKDETVAEYVTRFRNCAVEARITNNATTWKEHLMDKFFYSLPKEVRDLVDEHMTPEEMAALTAEALVKRIGDLVASNSKRFDGRYQANSKKRKNSNSGDAANQLKDEASEAGANFASNKLTDAQRSYRMKNKMCFWCGKTGHTERNCRTKRFGKKPDSANVVQPADSNKTPKLSKAKKRENKINKLVEEKLNSIIVSANPGTNLSLNGAGTLMSGAPNVPTQNNAPQQCLTTQLQQPTQMYRLTLANSDNQQQQ